MHFVHENSPAEDYQPKPVDPFDKAFHEAFEEVVKSDDPMPPPNWTASQVCSVAAKLVAGDRETVHGKKLQNFTNIAGMWNVILAAKRARGEHTFDAHDVANMMEAMKIARRYTGTVNLDDYVDGAGYAGVAAEVVQK